MNTLYKGLVGLALIAGCDNSSEIASAVWTERARQGDICRDEKQKLEQTLEQKLKTQLANAEQELAKAKAQAQTTCDARVNGAIAQYAPKPVEAAEDVTPQFPKMDQPMHGLLKGMAQGKYDMVGNLGAASRTEGGDLELPLLYKGWADGGFNVSYIKDCPADKKQVDLPAEHTACELGSALSYNPEDNTFQIDSWKEHTVKMGEEYQRVTESASYKGVGQTLEWSEVREVVLSTPGTLYTEQTIAIANLESVVVKGHTATMNAILSGLLAQGEEYVLKTQSAPTYDSVKRE